MQRITYQLSWICSRDEETGKTKEEREVMS